MRNLSRLLWCALIGLFPSRASLEAEILVLRHQLNVLRQKSPKRVLFSDVDRLLFAGLYHLVPGVLKALKIVKPAHEITNEHVSLGPASSPSRAPKSSNRIGLISPLD
jgi:hypothetical protein